jgi:DNA-binding XRE family transcriptional regulator
MVALSFWKKTISIVNGCFPVYLRNPITIGDHIRKRRLSLSMKQGDVGKVIGVSTDCITYWENNRSKPMVHQMPKIVKFLGYNPLSIEGSDLAGQLKSFRFKHGLSHKKMGQLLGVDASTIGSWEKGSPISRKNFQRLATALSSTIQSK